MLTQKDKMNIVESIRKIIPEKKTKLTSTWKKDWKKVKPVTVIVNTFLTNIQTGNITEQIHEGAQLEIKIAFPGGTWTEIQNIDGKLD